MQNETDASTQISTDENAASRSPRRGGGAKSPGSVLDGRVKSRLQRVPMIEHIQTQHPEGVENADENEDGEDGGSEKMPVPTRIREVDKGKRWFATDPRYYRWLVSQRAIYGSISPPLLAVRFEKEFGHPGGRTLEQIRATLHNYVYTSQRFAADVEKAKARTNGDLSLTAPMVMANTRLQVLNDIAEEALANDDKTMVLTAFKAIRDELGVGGSKSGSPVFNLNIQNKGSVSVTVGELFGLPDEMVEGLNPESMTGTARDVLTVGRRAALALTDGTNTSKKFIDVDANELPDLDKEALSFEAQERAPYIEEEKKDEDYEVPDDAQDDYKLDDDDLAAIEESMIAAEGDADAMVDPSMDGDE